MKKNINSITGFVILILLFSCNKNSLIEGVSNKGTEVVLNRSFLLSSFADYDIRPTLSNNYIGLLSIRTFATKGWSSTTQFTINDSIKSIFIGSTIDVEFAIVDRCHIKFALGENISSSPYAPQPTSIFLNFGKRMQPFTSPFVSLTSTFSISGIGNITPKFSLVDEGYIVYRRLVSSSGTTKFYEYGWIEISITNTSITFKRMGYRLGSPLKVGSIED